MQVLSGKQGYRVTGPTQEAWDFVRGGVPLMLPVGAYALHLLLAPPLPQSRLVPVTHDALAGFVVCAVIFMAATTAAVFWKKRLEALERNASGVSREGLLRLTWEEFEHFSAALFGKFPEVSRAQRTGGPHDNGADVVVHFTNGERGVVQCKHYGNGKWEVDAPAVRELAGAMKYFEAARGHILTTGTVTRPARDTVRKLGIAIWTAPDIVRRSRDHELRWTAAVPVTAATRAGVADPQARCAACEMTVTPAEESYCREHPRTFGGKVYCRPHRD